MKTNQKVIQSVNKYSVNRLTFTHKGIKCHTCLECKRIRQEKGLFELNNKPKPASKPYPHLRECLQRGKF